MARTNLALTLGALMLVALSLGSASGQQAGFPDDWHQEAQHGECSQVYLHAGPGAQPWGPTSGVAHKSGSLLQSLASLLCAGLIEFIQELSKELLQQQQQLQGAGMGSGGLAVLQASSMQQTVL